MSRRKLSTAEKDLWRQVVESTSPLKKLRSDTFLTASKNPKLEKSNRKKSPHFEIGSNAPRQAATAIPTPPSKLNVKMDHKAYAKMRRGKLVPEAHIDLHGLTVAKAHPTLNHFIQSAYAQGLRLILVITGKGKPNDEFDFATEGRGILRKQVPLWLTIGPLSRCVLQVQQSHARHGGAGAFYVYLKKNKPDK